MIGATMIIDNRRPRYPRQGPSCLLLIIFIAVFAVGLFVIVNADEVREAIQPTPAPEPTRDAVSFAVSADLYLRDGDFASAIENYERALALDADNVAFYTSLVELLIIEGRAEEALEWALLANDLAPEDYEVWELLAGAWLAYGDRLSETGEPLEADQAYASGARAAREAIQLNPESGVAYAYWAGAIIGQRGPEGVLEAQDQIELALALAPEDATVRRFRGLVLETQGLYGAAIQEYEIAQDFTTKPKELANLLILQAYNSFALQNVPEAILFFEDALRLDGESADAYDGLSYMYFLVGEYPRAADNAEEAVARDPDMVRAYAHLGAAQFRQNFYAQAIPNLEAAVSRYSSVTVANAIYFNMLGLAYFFELQDCGRARPLFEEVLEAIPDEPNALDGLSLCRAGS